MAIRGLSVTFPMECNQPQKQGRVIRRARAVALWLLSFENTYLLASNIRPSPSGAGSSAPRGLFALVAQRRGRHGEDLEQDPPRYESVVVGEKAEDEADP